MHCLWTIFVKTTDQDQDHRHVKQQWRQIIEMSFLNGNNSARNHFVLKAGNLQDPFLLMVQQFSVYVGIRVIGSKGDTSYSLKHNTNSKQHQAKYKLKIKLAF